MDRELDEEDLSLHLLDLAQVGDRVPAGPADCACSCHQRFPIEDYELLFIDAHIREAGAEIDVSQADIRQRPQDSIDNVPLERNPMLVQVLPCHGFGPYQVLHDGHKSAR